MPWPRLASGGVLVVAPFVLPAFALTTLTEVLILGLFALSLDLLVGYTGLESFGHHTSTVTPSANIAIIGSRMNAVTG